MDAVQRVIVALRHRADKLDTETERQPGDRPADAITRQLWGALATELRLLAEELEVASRVVPGSDPGEDLDGTPSEPNGAARP